MSGATARWSKRQGDSPSKLLRLAVAKSTRSLMEIVMVGSIENRVQEITGGTADSATGMALN